MHGLGPAGARGKKDGWGGKYWAAEATGRGKGERAPLRRDRGAAGAERAAGEAADPRLPTRRQFSVERDRGSDAGVGAEASATRARAFRWGSAAGTKPAATSFESAAPTLPAQDRPRYVLQHQRRGFSWFPARRTRAAATISPRRHRRWDRGEHEHTQAQQQQQQQQ